MKKILAISSLFLTLSVLLVGCGENRDYSDTHHGAGDAASDIVDGAGSAAHDAIDGAESAAHDVIDGVESALDDVTNPAKTTKKSR